MPRTWEFIPFLERRLRQDYNKILRLFNLFKRQYLTGKWAGATRTAEEMERVSLQMQAHAAKLRNALSGCEVA